MKKNMKIQQLLKSFRVSAVVEFTGSRSQWLREYFYLFRFYFYSDEVQIPMACNGYPLESGTSGIWCDHFYPFDNEQSYSWIIFRLESKYLITQRCLCWCAELHVPTHLPTSITLKKLKLKMLLIAEIVVELEHLFLTLVTGSFSIPSLWE